MTDRRPKPNEIGDELTQKPATVSVELVENDAIGLPHTIRVSVDEWNDADRVRITQPSSTPLAQTIESWDNLDSRVIDNLRVSAGVLVESEHGEWRTTVAKKWIAPDPLRIADDQPSVQDSAAAIMESDVGSDNGGGSDE